MTEFTLAGERSDNRMETFLLGAATNGSVLVERGAGHHERQRYCPYGRSPLPASTISRMGFNGERRESQGWYLLGNGHRAYNPALRRFHSPDGLSPFGKGGLNPYTYCLGDPVNFSDPTGRIVQEAHIASFVLQSMAFLTASLTLTLPALAARGGVFARLAERGAPLFQALTNSDVVASTLALFSSSSGITSTALQTQDPPAIGTELMWTMLGLSVTAALIPLGAGIVPKEVLKKGSRMDKIARVVHGKKHPVYPRSPTGSMRGSRRASEATASPEEVIELVNMPTQPVSSVSVIPTPSQPPTIPPISDRVRKWGEFNAALKEQNLRSRGGGREIYV